MLIKLIPLVLLLVGVGGGIGAGLFLRPPAPDAQAEMDAEPAEAGTKKENVPDKDMTEGKDGPVDSAEFVKMSNQFVVPILRDQKVSAMVVMSLSVEVPAGGKDPVFRSEPRLRDSFLQVLFDHANIGGFDGAFTAAGNMETLRVALTEAAQKDMGVDLVRNVLIQEIARQDY